MPSTSPIGLRVGRRVSVELYNNTVYGSVVEVLADKIKMKRYDNSKVLTVKKSDIQFVPPTLKLVNGLPVKPKEEANKEEDTKINNKEKNYTKTKSNNKEKNSTKTKSNNKDKEFTPTKTNNKEKNSTKTKSNNKEKNYTKTNSNNKEKNSTKTKSNNKDNEFTQTTSNNKEKMKKEEPTLKNTHELKYNNTDSEIQEKINTHKTNLPSSMQNKHGIDRSRSHKNELNGGEKENSEKKVRGSYLDRRFADQPHFTIIHPQYIILSTIFNPSKSVGRNVPDYSELKMAIDIVNKELKYHTVIIAFVDYNNDLYRKQEDAINKVVNSNNRHIGLKKAIEELKNPPKSSGGIYFDQLNYELIVLEVEGIYPLPYLEILNIFAKRIGLSRYVDIRGHNPVNMVSFYASEDNSPKEARHATKVLHNVLLLSYSD